MMAMWWILTFPGVFRVRSLWWVFTETQVTELRAEWAEGKHDGSWCVVHWTKSQGSSVFVCCAFSWVTYLLEFISFTLLSFLSWFLRQLKRTAFVTFVLQPNPSEYRQRGVTFWVARAQLLLGIMKISSALPSTLVRESEVCLWCAAVALPGIENKIHRNVIWWLVWIIVIQSLLLYDLSRYFKTYVLVFFFNLWLCGAELIIFIPRKDNSWTSKAT